MPWCEPCERFYSPNTVTRQGQCPQCGYQLGDAQVEVADRRVGKAPWHFKLLVLAAGGYVGWRLVQLAVRGLQALF